MEYSGKDLTDNNARPITANVVQEYLERPEITRLDWPDHSSGLLVIEYEWNELHVRIFQPVRSSQETPRSLVPPLSTAGIPFHKPSYEA
jgi:hypothetical protein